MTESTSRGEGLAVIPGLLGPLTQFSEPTVGGGYVVAMALVVFLQYLGSLAKQGRVRQLAEQYRRQANGLSSEVLQLNRERLVHRLENQILREVLAQTDCNKVVSLLLKRYTPNPEDEFSAFLPLEPTPDFRRQTRGLTTETGQTLCVPSDVLNELKSHGAIVWETATVARSPLFTQLAPVDRRKAREVFAFGVGHDGEMLGVFLTTALLPIAAPRIEQQDLAMRLIASIAPSLRQMLELERQTTQLRCTREMLELRSITDTKYDQPMKLLEKFLARLAQMVGAERAALFLLARESGGMPRATVRCGVQLQPGIAERWIKHEERLAQAGVLEDSAKSFGADNLPDLGVDSLIGSALTAPLVQEGRVIGLICLTRRAVTDMSSAQRQLLTWSAETLSHVIQRMVSLVAIERQARQDGLTELANRRTFDWQLQHELAQLRDGAIVECSLLLLDLDHFKSINDKYGHQAGDEVLRETAAVLREQMSRMRAGDRGHLARYGGEEMAVLLPGVGINGAMRIAEQIRAAVEHHPTEFNGSKIDVTASIGVATCPLHASNAEELLAVTDASLYQAKSAGRNCVICPSDPFE